MKYSLTFLLTIIWTVLAAVVMALLPAGCATAAPAPAPQAASSLLPQRVMAAAHDRVATGQYPMLIIGVVEDGKSKLYGFNAAGEPAPRAGTVFEIGSITKTFTGLALALAVESGSLALDEPVEKLLPTFTIPKRHGKVITLENLATQHSGLPRLPGNLDPWKNPGNPYADYNAGKLKRFLFQYKLKHDPGSHYKYSNLGFGLLGYALAQHAGLSYGQLLQRSILGPLKMKSCAVDMDKVSRKRLARGHDASGAVVPNWNMAALSGAGALKCSAADMMRYLKANMGVIDTPLYSAMQLAHKPRADGPGRNKVGLGWLTLDTGDKNIVWHNGMTGGYASFIGFTADGNKGVFVITNSHQSVDDLGFASLIKGAKLAPAIVQMSPTQLDDYTGYYRLAPRFLLTIFRRQDQLYAEATGQGAFPIYPSAANEFFAKVGGISLSFLRGDADKVLGLVLHQHGDTRALKVNAAAAAEAVGRHLQPLDKKVLQDYVGRYQLDPNTVIAITLEHGQLYAQLTGQAAMPIYPSEKNRFFFFLVNAELNFERGDNGRVKAVTLHQHGVKQLAPRIKTR